MRRRMATITGQRAMSRGFARRSLSMSAALRIIARGELTGVGAAWRRVTEGGLPPLEMTLSLSPPRKTDSLDTYVETIRWTARRRRLLEAYGLGGELVQHLNAGTTPPNPRTRTERFDDWMARESLYRELSRSSPVACRVEAALFEAAGFWIRPCYSQREPHWFIGPRTVASA